MLIINRKVFLFELFAVIMFLCQYRIAKKQGYILFFLEISIGFICWLWSTKKKVLISKYLFVYMALIIYKIILTLLVSGGSIENAKNILYKELGMLFLCFFLVGECSDVTIIKRLREFGLLTSILGGYEFVTHSNIFRRYITVESRIYMQTLGTSKTRVQTVFMHPTICGVFMMISWLCILYMPYKKSWVNYLAKFSIIFCLLGTQSRSIWITFVVINILYIWRKFKRNSIRINRRGFFSICILGTIGLIVAIYFQDSISSVVQVVLNRWRDGMDSKNSANYNRVTMIKMGIKEWMNVGLGRKIFGSGNGYAYDFLLTDPIRGWNGAVDNQYLTVLMDFGLVGIVFLFSLIYYAFKKTISSENEINQLCALCLLAMFISGFFYEMFSWIFVTLLFCLFFCILEKNTGQKIFS